MADSDNPDCLAMLGMPHNSRPTMKECTRFLTQHCPQWYEIGLKLGLRQPLLEVIKLDNYMKTRDCFRITIQKWLEQNVNADWKTLELAITNAKREAGALEQLTMDAMIAKLEALQFSKAEDKEHVKEVVPVQEREEINSFVPPVRENRIYPQEQINGVQDYGQEQRNGGAAVIDPETAPTVCRGKGIVKDAVFAETKKAICRIVSPSMTGTGFLGYTKCGEGKYCTVLVTNNHVITNFDDAMGSRLIFENVFDHNVTLRGPDIFVMNSFWSSPMTELDFALIEVDDSKLVDPTTKRSLDINSIQMIRPADIREGDQIYVIQHPRGEQIAFSSSDSVVLDPLLLYQCTTDYGSSGSPVFKEVDGELKVVALHRGGRDGGEKRLGYNCGTLIKEILNHLYGNQIQSLPSNHTVQEALRRINK